MAVILKPAPEGSVCCCCDKPAIATIQEIEDGPTKGEEFFARTMVALCNLGQFLIVASFFAGAVAVLTQSKIALITACYCTMASIVLFVILRVVLHRLTGEPLLPFRRR